MSGLLIKLKEWRMGLAAMEKAKRTAYIKGWRAGWWAGFRRGYRAAELGTPLKEQHHGSMDDS